MNKKTRGIYPSGFFHFQHLFLRYEAHTSNLLSFNRQESSWRLLAQLFITHGQAP